MEEPILIIDDNSNKNKEFQKSQIYKSVISEQDGNTTILSRLVCIMNLILPIKLKNLNGTMQSTVNAL